MGGRADLRPPRRRRDSRLRPGRLRGAGEFRAGGAHHHGELVHWWRNEQNNQWAQSATFGSGGRPQRRDTGQHRQRAGRGGRERARQDAALLARRRTPQGLGGGRDVRPRREEPSGHDPGAVRRDRRDRAGQLRALRGGGRLHPALVDPHHGHRSFDPRHHLGSGVKQVLGLIQSSFGFDLEVVALLQNGSLQHFWRTTRGTPARSLPPGSDGRGGRGAASARVGPGLGSRPVHWPHRSPPARPEARRP